MGTHINDRTKILENQGFRACLFYFIKTYERILKGANAKAKANAAQGLLELIEIAAGKKFLLVILLYFSKHFYVIMKTEL